MYCEICKRDVGVLGRHLCRTHKTISAQWYYDTYLAKPGEGFCKECGKRLKFRKLSEPYRTFCCQSCAVKNENTQTKIEQTILDLHGITRSELIKNQFNERNKLLGIDNISQLKEVKDKVQKTRNKHIKEIGKNISNALKNRTDEEIKSWIEHIEESKLKNHGDAHYNNQEQIKITNKEKYGTECVFNSDYYNEISRRKYTYKNIHFDSSWEIAYYIWLEDHNIDFEYHTNDKFLYYYNGEKHEYKPDFKINGEFVEIKSLHFFENKNINGKMINPFKRSKYTKEELELRDGIMEAKHQCMIENKIKIITDCTEYINYVKRTRSSNFLKNLKNKK